MKNKSKSKKKGSKRTQEQDLLQEEMNDECSASVASSHSDPETCLEVAEEANGAANEVANASLQAILRELRASRRDNENNFKELKEEMKTITGRLTNAECRIVEVEERSQRVEEATVELIKMQEKLETKITDLEGRSRRENLRFHGIAEGAEDSSVSVSAFIEDLIKVKLNMPPSLNLAIERAHRSLGPKPPPNAWPRSIVVKFSSFKAKEEVLKLAWQMKGFTLNGNRVTVDHDYAPDVLKQRREYTEAKKILREKKIKFQTPYPARMRVFYDGETCLYNSAAEATKDMARRGFTVSVITPPTTWADKLRSAMWHTVGQSDKRGPPDDGAKAGYKKRLEAFRRE